MMTVTDNDCTPSQSINSADLCSQQSRWVDSQPISSVWPLWSQRSRWVDTWQSTHRFHCDLCGRSGADALTVNPSVPLTFVATAEPIGWHLTVNPSVPLWPLWSQRNRCVDSQHIGSADLYGHSGADRLTLDSQPIGSTVTFVVAAELTNWQSTHQFHWPLLIVELKSVVSCYFTHSLIVHKYV